MVREIVTLVCATIVVDGVVLAAPVRTEVTYEVNRSPLRDALAEMARDAAAIDVDGVEVML